MAKEKKVSRKDSKGRVLRKGESERKDGTYMYRYMDECKNRKSVYAKTLPELRQKEFEIEQDKANDIRVSVNYTVEQLMVLYIDVYTDNLAKSTKRLATNAYKSHIKDTWFGKKPVKKVRNSDVVLFYKELSQNKKLSNNSIQIIDTTLHNTFNVALRDRVILSNPTYGAAKLFPPDPKEKTILTPEQVDSFKRFLRGSSRYYKWYPLIVVFLETMIRGGELCGIVWDNVDLNNRILTIDHQLQTKRGKGKDSFYICPPKTKSGKRKIPLTEEAYEAFLLQKESLAKRNITPKFEVDGYRDFVFLTQRGTPNTVVLINQVLKNIAAYYNADHPTPLPNLSCHVFRHTGCAITAKKFFRLGLDPKILQGWMGHSSLKMTLSLYNHVTDDDNKEAIEMMDLINRDSTKGA